MKTPQTLAFLGLMLAVASSGALADTKKKTAQTQVSTTSNQTSIRHLRLKLRARQAVTINQ